MADFGATELEAFRTEARTWLEANYPASLREHPEPVSAGDERGRQGPPATSSSGASAWAKRAGACRPGPSSTAAAA